MLTVLEHPTLGKSDYNARLNELQLKLMTLQHGLYQQQKRCVIVVEGTDAAGKGGMIRRVTQLMDPRGYRVHPIGAPSDMELQEHYLQRFWRRLPKQGQLTVFDRSWYGRVLAERVENLASKKTWTRAFLEINELERQLVDDGVIVIKLFLSIEKNEQLSRFRERLSQEHKRWKLTPDDLTAREKWDEYQLAFEEMLDKTNTKSAPWHVVGANQKRHARITSMAHIADSLAQHIDTAKVKLLDPRVKQLAKNLA